MLSMCVYSVLFFFFFSSRRRHTRYIGDWSSDVCSSDLPSGRAGAGGDVEAARGAAGHATRRLDTRLPGSVGRGGRSEERRVGKECRSRWAPGQLKKAKRAERRAWGCEYCKRRQRARKCA